AVDSRFAHESPINAFSLSADGKLLLTAAIDRTAKLWSVPELVELHAYPTQPDVVAALWPDAAGREFIAGRMNGSLDKLAVLDSHPRPDVELATAKSAPVASVTNLVELAEQEPNSQPGEAQAIQLPAEIKGAINGADDRDLYRFQARAGEELTLAINAARSGSKLDSRVEVLFPDGRPVEQVVLQAVRDSWFTFRGKDSDTSDDFRLQNWTEMELNEYLYANGEVVRLWLYPRGPDSGFKVYPGEGKRQTEFSTTALTHALNEPAYIVQPHPAGSEPVPNGLPVFRLNYENDDDPSHQWGADSLLLFTAPRDGEYLARVSDVRGFGGETNYHYALTVRPRQPDFAVSVGGKNPKVSPGSGREITFAATRIEGYEGPIRIDVENLPAGFTSSAPVEIEAGQRSAIAVLHAYREVIAPDQAADEAVRVIATAVIGGREVRHELGSLGDIQLAAPPKVTLAILPGSDPSAVRENSDQPAEFFIRPGQTISALVRATRSDFEGRIEMGTADAGRNLPHGVFVDNIGLNGLLIVEGHTEREFFITASPVAQPGRRKFHLRATADDGQASLPVILEVLPATAATGRRASLEP
ncbi:MAG TPA: hypothetical protein DCY13_11330, partial [Verrucomicrobiales bacterium]|nr:hypothetical protein [Verrucomicrobiales bacterium]